MFLFADIMRILKFYGEFLAEMDGMGRRNDEGVRLTLKWK